MDSGKDNASEKAPYHSPVVRQPYHAPIVRQLDIGLGTNAPKQFGGSEVTTPGYKGGPRTS